MSIFLERVRSNQTMWCTAPPVGRLRVNPISDAGNFTFDEGSTAMEQRSKSPVCLFPSVQGLLLTATLPACSSRRRGRRSRDTCVSCRQPSGNVQRPPQFSGGLCRMNGSRKSDPAAAHAGSLGCMMFMFKAQGRQRDFSGLAMEHHKLVATHSWCGLPGFDLLQARHLSVIQGADRLGKTSIDSIMISPCPFERGIVPFTNCDFRKTPIAFLTSQQQCIIHL